MNNPCVPFVGSYTNHHCPLSSGNHAIYHYAGFHTNATDNLMLCSSFSVCDSLSSCYVTWSVAVSAIYSVIISYIILFVNTLFMRLWYIPLISISETPLCHVNTMYMECKYRLETWEKIERMRQL